MTLSLPILFGEQSEPMTSKLLAENVWLEYGDDGNKITALQNIDLSIQDGELITIVGPSGCGKSSFLNLVAGFMTPSRGKLELESLAIRGPGADRGVVFQEHALFSWMTVRQNIGYGPRIQKKPRVEVDRRVNELLELVGLTSFANSWPKALSGGMKQRVAIARALANRPKMLLMDEPFAALDAQTRRFLQTEVLRVWEQTGTTVLFVTHSIDEAVLLSSRIVVMTARPGRIKTIIDVPLARPRDENQLEFLEIRRRVAEALEDELQH